MAAALVALWACVGLALGQTRDQPAVPPQPRTSQEIQEEQVFGRLANAWGSFYSGKYQDAAQQADVLTKIPDPHYKWVTIEAAHLTARCSFASGTAQGRTRAQQLWKQIERLDPSLATKTRLQIAKAPISRQC
jgi:hypothetical protein